ncbi:hypothetical protein IJJ12_02870, partial [bacterium]|nr:hypothetical protein [bacterium]
ALARAATIPAGYLEFGKYVKVGATDYISGHELACKPGNDYCGNGSKWSTALSKCIRIPTTMQDFTSDFCNTFTTPGGTGYTAVGNFIDVRNNVSYTVRKFADGRCWMANNLKFGNCGNGVWTGDPDGYSKDSIGSGLYGACLYDDSYDGYYYNWQAAVQDANAYYDQDYQPTEPRQGICPSGWYLPTISSFASLYSSVGNVLSFFQPGGNFATIYAGGREPSNPPYDHGKRAYFWSSTNGGSTTAYFWLATSDTNVAQPYNGAKYYGRNIRCVSQ